MQLQQELADKEARIDAVKEHKVKCLAEIKTAERVREECRGWSTTEVKDLKGIHTLPPIRYSILTPSQPRLPLLKKPTGGA
jgi:kinetochore protein Spc7/SPC105